MTSAPVNPNAQLTRPVPGNRVFNTFSDQQALEAMIRDIGQAQRSVQFESFLFNSAHGQKMADALSAAARKGRHVQVMLHPAELEGRAAPLVAQMRQAGAEVRPYNTRLLRHNAYSVEHAKVAVIDDTRAWVGGANFDAEVNRDMMTRIDGPAVLRIQSTFNRGWINAGGQALPIRQTPKVQGDVWVGVSQTAPGEASTRQQVLDELNALGKGDKADAWMMDIGDPQVLDAMLAAHARGAQFRVLYDTEVPFVNGKPIDRLKAPLLRGTPDLPAVRSLLKAGIPVRAYAPPKGITKLHAKVWVFTKYAGTPQQTRRVLGGSVNAIKSAYEFNHEVGFLMYGPHVGNDVEEAIEEDWTQHSVPAQAHGFFAALKAQFVKVLTHHLI